MLSLTRRLGGVRLDDIGNDPSSLLPRLHLSPFLDLSEALKVRASPVPVRSSPDVYLASVESNILAEFAAFASTARGDPYLAHLIDSDSISSVRKIAMTGDAGSLTEEKEKLASLHCSLAVVDGCTAVLTYNKRDDKLHINTSHNAHAGLRMPAGLLDINDGTDKKQKQTVIFVLGYAGTFLNEYSACKHLRGLPTGEQPQLLRAVADPIQRTPARFNTAATVGDTVVPINARQREVLDSLVHNIEGIQGPPGTGKSTVIWHVVHSYLPENGVALATCVQNKAVDAIAEKLSSSATIPFFVHGNTERLGLKAREWALDPQVDRDVRVVALNHRIRNLVFFSEVVTLRCTFLLNLCVNTRKYRQRRADTLFGGKNSMKIVDEDFLKEEWLVRDGWSRLWAAHVKHQHPRLFFAMRAINDALRLHRSALASLRVQVSQELVLAARVVLCTVDTASRSLLTDVDLRPAVQRITTVILDEAGTAPESKLPLLLLLPHLTRILAIGDQNQLPPFSHVQSGGGGGVCRSFAMSGVCRFGMSCKFKHTRGASSMTRPGTGGSEEQLGFFQRIERALPANAVSMLCQQYRMHPAIAAFVSGAFYRGALITPPEVELARRLSCPTGLFWLNYPRGMVNCEATPPRSTSKVNECEAKLAVEVVRGLDWERKRLSVMVITFYKSQESLCVRLLRWGAGGRVGLARDAHPLYCRLTRTFVDAGFSKQLAEAGSEDMVGRGSLRIMSVDQSQGSEADVVVLSCVRSNSERSVGFVGKTNRVNVAVSRARSRLICIGDRHTLGSSGGSHWTALIDQAMHVLCASALPEITAPNTSFITTP